MAILLLIIAILFWFVAGIPGFISIAVGRVDWGWLGMFFFGLWLLLGGSTAITSYIRRA
jgi:hypothetical protein